MNKSLLNEVYHNIKRIESSFKRKQISINIYMLKKIIKEKNNLSNKALLYYLNTKDDLELINLKELNYLFDMIVDDFESLEIERICLNNYFSETNFDLQLIKYEIVEGYLDNVFDDLLLNVILDYDDSICQFDENDVYLMFCQYVSSFYDFEEN